VKKPISTTTSGEGFGPSSELRKAFHGDVDFAAFREAYLAELADKHETGKQLCEKE
jgi:uncharacterized protein YeaO (DUF488 family)